MDHLAAGQGAVDAIGPWGSWRHSRQQGPPVGFGVDPWFEKVVLAAWCLGFVAPWLNEWWEADEWRTGHMGRKSFFKQVAFAQGRTCLGRLRTWRLEGVITCRSMLFIGGTAHCASVLNPMERLGLDRREK